MRLAVAAVPPDQAIVAFAVSLSIGEVREPPPPVHRVSEFAQRPCWRADNDDAPGSREPSAGAQANDAADGDRTRGEQGEGRQIGGMR